MPEIEIDPLHIEAIIRRLKAFFSVSKDVELTRALGRSDSWLSHTRKRRRIPYDVLMALCIEHKISMDWWLFGLEVTHLKRGPMPEEPES